MKLKFGMIVTDGRGKLGGHVLSKNRAGAYARTKVTPSNPQTVAQSSARALFGSISQGWSGLTAIQRDAWNAAVADWQKTDIFGDLRSPSGKALYQRLNNQAATVGYSQSVLPPARQEMVSGVVSSVTINPTLATISLTGAFTGSDATVQLSATPALSAGTSFVKNKLSVIYNVEADSFDSTDAFSGFLSKFGTISTGDNVYVAVKYVLPNGQASPVQIIKANVL